MTIPASLKISCILTALAITGAFSHGALIGLDTASDVAYNSPGFWQNGDDGGTAGTFGAWGLSTFGGGSAGHFIGDSTSLAGPGANINSAGESFGMFGHSGGTSEAYRDFNGATLGVGQIFSLDLAVNFQGGNKGFDLRNSADAVIFNLNIGGGNYTVSNAATGNGTLGAQDPTTAFELSFTQTSLAGGTWSIARSGGITDLDSGTYSGVAENFKFYNSNAGSAGGDNLYFNNLEVVPEPATFGFIAAPLLAIGFVRRRRAALI